MEAFFCLPPRAQAFEEHSAVVFENPSRIDECRVRPEKLNCQTGSRRLKTTIRLLSCLLSAAIAGCGSNYVVTPGQRSGNSTVPTLTLDANSVSFGAVRLNTPATQPVTVISSGTAALTITAGSVTGAGFSISGMNFPTTLSPGQSATLYVLFNPSAAGTATGTVTLTSNASPHPASIPLSGMGTTGSHQVNLSWNTPAISTVPIAGYNVYRAAGGNNSYQRLNPSLNLETAYTDLAVQSGGSYTYYVESVDADGNQSMPSNSYTISIP